MKQSPANVYAYVIAKIDENSRTFTFRMEDMYNFNKGMQDIASGTPDEVNGRFSELEWAKEFKTYGSSSKDKTTKFVCGVVEYYYLDGDFTPDLSDKRRNDQESDNCVKYFIFSYLIRA